MKQPNTKIWPKYRRRRRPASSKLRIKLAKINSTKEKILVVHEKLALRVKRRNELFEQQNLENKINFTSDLQIYNFILMEIFQREVMGRKFSKSSLNKLY